MSWLIYSSSAITHSHFQILRSYIEFEGAKVMDVLRVLIEALGDAEGSLVGLDIWVIVYL